MKKQINTQQINTQQINTQRYQKASLLKRASTLTLASLMAVSLAVPSIADGGEITVAGNGATVPVTLTAKAATFSVTVPSSLPIEVGSDNTVTTAENATIINNGAGPVLISNIEVNGKDSWKVVDFDTDMSSIPVNSTIFGFKILDAKTTETGEGEDKTVSLAYNTEAPKKIDAKDELKVTYDAVLPARSEATDEGTTLSIAEVVFTVAWDKEEQQTPES